MIRKSNLSILLSSFVAILMMSACSSSKHKAETTFDEIDSLRAYFLTIEDSLLYSWNVMIHDDNERISDLSRLLDELKYANALDSNIIIDYKEKVNNLKKHRYYMTKMKSAQIDIYDSISFALSSEIFRLALDFQDFGRYPFLNELMDSIDTRESKILRYRLNYDKIAKIHNQFIVDNNTIIDQINADYKHTILPLFELPFEEQ
ncbi:MAG: hypothetical protein OEX22_01195 [Cyclobacteriaceae bacterium]|nr:hypothetical protein [Cyclobacteriaceae bacterium]